jgi:hypothetical protein
LVGRAKKKGAPSSGEFSLFEESDSADVDAEEDLPRDEAGRAKIKHQYVDLLGIRVQKLAGRILNRERINKTLEGIYFVCVRCKKVCHNLDEGLLEDSENRTNICVPCSKQAAEPAAKAPGKKTAAAAKVEAVEFDEDDEDEAAPVRKPAPKAKAPAKPAGKPASKPAAKPDSKSAAKAAPAKKKK